MKLTISSPLGPIAIVADESGVTEANFGRRGAGGARLVNGPAKRGALAAAAALERYFAGDLEALEDLPLAPEGSDFQRRVWRLARKIKPGSTLSYGELAARVGSPLAARAVGGAMNRNPICIIVPCHRIVGSNGSLVGYAGGLQRKRWLLEHEGALVSTRSAAVAAVG